MSDKIGFWDIDNSDVILERILNKCNEFISDSEYPDTKVDDVVVFGSFGLGIGIQGESDLDILIIIDNIDYMY